MKAAKHCGGTFYPPTHQNYIQVLTIQWKWVEKACLLPSSWYCYWLPANSWRLLPLVTLEVEQSTDYKLWKTSRWNVPLPTTTTCNIYLWASIQATQKSDLYSNLRTSHPTVLQYIGQRCTYIMSILTKLATIPSSKFPSSLAKFKYTRWKKSGKKIKLLALSEKLGCHGLSRILLWMVVMLRKECWTVWLFTQAGHEALLNLILLKPFAAGRKVVPTMVLW